MGDLLAPAVNVAGAFVIIAQQVVPEAQPMLGVVAIVGEQPVHQPLPLVLCAGPPGMPPSSSGGGSSPITSRYARRANTRSLTGLGGLIWCAAK